MKVNKTAYVQAQLGLQLAPLTFIPKGTPIWQRLLVLMKAADKLAKKKGHELGYWSVWTGELARSKCKKCGEVAGCVAEPCGSEKEISGAAVEKKCKGEE